LFNDSDTLANTGDRLEDDPMFAGVKDVFISVVLENTVFMPFII
jgi:hypothetical protein